MSTPEAGDRVVCRFDFDTTYFWAEGDVVSINKHGRARVQWDDPPMSTGLMPLSALVKVSPLSEPQRTACEDCGGSSGTANDAPGSPCLWCGGKMISLKPGDA